MPYVRDGHLSVNISLFALKCGDLLFHTCELDAKLDVFRHGRLSARDRFVQSCVFH